MLFGLGRVLGKNFWRLAKTRLVEVLTTLWQNHESKTEMSLSLSLSSLSNQEFGFSGRTGHAGERNVACNVSFWNLETGCSSYLMLYIS